jgi:hypothetical protein
MKPIDVASNGLLKYDNEDGGDSFQYRLANIEPKTYFELTVHNQDDEFIPSFSDYILLLQFIRHSTTKKNNIRINFGLYNTNVFDNISNSISSKLLKNFCFI